MPVIFSNCACSDSVTKSSHEEFVISKPVVSLSILTTFSLREIILASSSVITLPSYSFLRIGATSVAVFVSPVAISARLATLPSDTELSVSTIESYCLISCLLLMPLSFARVCFSSISALNVLLISLFLKSESGSALSISVYLPLCISSLILSDLYILFATV